MSIVDRMNKTGMKNWSQVRLVENKDFMVKQRNRMMYKTLVLKRDKFVGLEEFLIKADLGDKRNFYTRGLTFIRDLIFSDEETGKIDNYMYQGKEITVANMIEDKELVYDLLYQAIGIEALTLMMVKEQFLRGPQSRPMYKDSRGQDIYYTFPLPTYSGTMMRNLMISPRVPISCSEELYNKAVGHLISVNGRLDFYRYNAILDPIGKMVDNTLEHLTKLSEDIKNGGSIVMDKVQDYLTMKKEELEGMGYRINVEIPTSNFPHLIDKDEMLRAVNQFIYVIKNDEKLREHKDNYKKKVNRFRSQ